MFESEQKLRHLAFFEELAAREEHSPEWRSAAAGLVVIRFVDSWLEDGVGIMADDSWALTNVRTTVDELDSGWPGKAILSNVLEAVEGQRPAIHAVVRPLMAYAQLLEYDARWTLAADVYHMLLAHLHPIDDSDASVNAHLRLGQCYRTLNLNPEAAKAFADAGAIASRVGDLVGVLRARIGEGRNAMFAGNLPLAEEILDDAVAQAESAKLSEVLSRALHVRSNIAYFRGQYELAIRLAYRALEDAPAQVNRDRILNDLGASFLDLGVLSAARDAYLILSVTAQEQYLRWAATLNLLDIAWRSGAEPLFEGYRRELLATELPPYQATGFALSQGLGYQRFGDHAKASRYLNSAIALAKEHGFSQYLFEAETALRNLDKPLQITSNPQTSLEVQEVASAIERLKERAGV